MKCCFIFPDFIGAIIIAIFNIVIGIADLCLMAKAYSDLEETTVIENLSLFVSVVFICLQFFLLYGLLRKNPKIVLIWIVLEAIGLVVSQFFHLSISLQTLCFFFCHFPPNSRFLRILNLN